MPQDIPETPSYDKPELELVENVLTSGDPKEEQQTKFIAHLADQEQHDQTAWQALTENKWNTLWIFYAIWCSMAEAFDHTAAGSVISIPSFRQDYGYYYNGGYVLPAKWRSAYSGGPAAGLIFGTLLCVLGDRIGRKWFAAFNYALFLIGITVETISNTQKDPKAVFFDGKFINGFAIGGMLPTALTSIGEIAPLKIRGVFTVAGSIPFALGGILVVTFIGAIFLPLMPESPVWLISKGRDEAALRSLRRLGWNQERQERMVANIKLTLKQAEKKTAGATYLDWWLAGMSVSMSFQLTIALMALTALGNITLWFTIERIGRRPPIVGGLVFLTGLLFAIGGLATIGTPAASTGAVAMMLPYAFSFSATIGSIAYASMVEIGSSRLRNKTASIALMGQSMLNLMWNFVLPHLFNPNELNLQAKVAFIFGALSVLCCVYAYFCHPETKGRSYEELDEMFVKKVPARQVSTFVTDNELRNRAAQRAVAEGRAFA